MPEVSPQAAPPGPRDRRQPLSYPRKVTRRREVAGVAVEVEDLGVPVLEAPTLFLEWLATRARRDEWRHPSPLRERGAHLRSDEVARIMGVIISGGGTALAARTIGISAGALRDRISKDADLRERIDEAREIRKELLEAAHVRKALEGHPVAQIFALKNLAGWADRQTVSGRIEHQILPTLVEKSFDPKVLEAVEADVVSETRALEAPAPDLPSPSSREGAHVVRGE
jgi:hypothetical protein